MGEYFTLQPKKSSSTVTTNLFKCPTLNCSYSSVQNVCHYHCKLCDFADANCSVRRRKTHLKKKHNIIFEKLPSENVTRDNPHETRFVIPFSHESQLSTTETVTLDHQYFNNTTDSPINNHEISDSIVVSPFRRSILQKS